MKKTTTKATNWYVSVEELNNPVMLTGLCKRLVYEGEKFNKVCFEVASKTRNDKIRRAWITVVDFEGALEVGKVYDISATITSNSYNNKMSLEFILNSANEL